MRVAAFTPSSLLRRRHPPTRRHAAAFRFPHAQRTGMPQLFSPDADRRLRIALVLGACVIVVGAAAGFAFARSDRAWGVGVAAPQPIPFSHAIHAGEIGLDCRYCHATVERGASAGMPTAETCLGCHAQVWNVSAQFAPLATALALEAPVTWRSVHRLPDHVRFHHAAHVAAGLGCVTCHGDVAAMPRTVKAETLSMGWCLDCHRSATTAFGASLRFEHAGIEVSYTDSASGETSVTRTPGGVPARQVTQHAEMGVPAAEQHQFPSPGATRRHAWPNASLAASLRAEERRTPTRPCPSAISSARARRTRRRQRGCVGCRVLSAAPAATRRRPASPPGRSRRSLQAVWCPVGPSLP
ncbi:cytochrome c3 family protein [Falsiroseomonas oryziterrae]|uniref:cytochrome c3 family protein n=1 Tax=Falsiroseomonas oryziterrae TaxID=2911368 RepID=UPI003558B780